MIYKNHKNIFLSLASYILAVIWFTIWIQVGNAFATAHSSYTGNSMNIFVLAVFFILLIVGIIFGIKSNKAKESSWAGNLLAVIGIVILIGYFVLMSGFAGY